MHIAYFAHEIEDPAVRKRVDMLAAGGADVSLLGFERGRHAAPQQGPKARVLGRTRSGRLVSRVCAVLLAVPRVLALRSGWSGADAILARNLEMLAIVVAAASLLRSKARVVYECLDIHRLMLSEAAPGAALRAIERACLRRTALVVTSSPAFEMRYFRGVQRYGGETLVVENKVLALNEPQRTPRRSIPPEGPPWRIAWCGVLRCRKSLGLLRELTEKLGGLVEVDLWGRPSLDQMPDFHEIVAGARHMTFRGSYAREDLPAIYAAAHFVWAVDYYEAGGNSDWLLPNRLYEGLSFGAAPIAVDGVETARWLGARQVGVVLQEPLAASLLGFFEACDARRVEDIRRAAASLDAGATTATHADCRALTAALTGSGGAAERPA